MLLDELAQVSLVPTAACLLCPPRPSHGEHGEHGEHAPSVAWTTSPRVCWCWRQVTKLSKRVRELQQELIEKEEEEERQFSLSRQHASKVKPDHDQV